MSSHDPNPGGAGGGAPRPPRRNPRPNARRRAEVAVVTDLHEFATWWSAKVVKFPKDFKHTLGHRSIDVVLELLELLVEAAYVSAPERPALLSSANRAVERLRHLVRLAHSTASLAHEAYGHASERLDTIGRQVGAWLKSSSAASRATAP